MQKSVLILLLLLSLILAACKEENEPEAATDAAQDEVSIQFNWLHSIAWVGFYMAADEGLYRQQNLDVTMLEGGFDEEGNPIDPIQEVLSGNAQFGIAEGSILLEAREQGQPVVAIATIYQRHPLAFTSLADSNIVRPQDLVGTTVHVSGNSGTLLQALLRAQDIDPDSVNIVDRTDFSTELLTSGNADVIDAWVINEIVVYQREDVATNMILPSDYGIDFYPNVIFTTEALIAEQPELVERFLRASVEGMRQSVENPETATELTLRYKSDSSEETEFLAMQQSLPLIAPPDTNPGSMQAEIWETMHQLLLDEGVLDAPLEIADAYTLQFLNAIYEN